MSATHTTNNYDFRVPDTAVRWQSRALVVGIGGAVASIVMAVVRPDDFLRGYLVAFMLWLGLSLGCLALLMLQYVSGGLWGLITRRFLEAGSKGFLLMAVLFLPIAIGAHSLYEVWVGKGFNRWLTLPGFYLRAVAYFAIWAGLSYVLSRWSRQYDQGPDARLSSRFQSLSAPGLILYVFTISFAAVDWVMSLSFPWISTIYGLLYLAGQGISALAFSLIMLRFATLHQPYDEIVSTQQIHDIGKLMMAFTLLWAYFSYSQYLIIWSGNLPEEVPWYLRRTKGAWGAVALFIVVFHFIVPFAIMLSQNFKRNLRKLAALAAFMLVMRAVELFWHVAPSFTHSHAHSDAPMLLPALAAVLSIVGIGGLWTWLFFLNLRKAPLLPAYEPQMELLMSQHHGH